MKTQLCISVHLAQEVQEETNRDKLVVGGFYSPKFMTYT